MKMKSSFIPLFALAVLIYIDPLACNCGTAKRIRFPHVRKSASLDKNKVLYEIAIATRWERMA